MSHLSAKNRHHINGGALNMKNKFIKLLMAIITIITVMILIMPVSSFANSNKQQAETPLPFCDTKEGRIVEDMDTYLLQLNKGTILPYDPVIIEYNERDDDKGQTRGVISEPTHSCSNIFGHKWSDWGAWEEVIGARVHFPGAPYCMATIQRWRYCERTHCVALQKEMDYAWVECNCK